MSKWVLRDPNRRQQLLVGTLRDVHVSDADGDTNLVIEPDPAERFQDLLRNHNQTPNADGMIECEICVPSQWRAQHKEWVASLTEGDARVTAIGIWVEDTGHDSKTELHPLDVVFGRITSSLIPGDWIGEMALGVRLNAFRFAAASDVRNELFVSRPIDADVTRHTTFELDLPPRPAEGNLAPASAMRISLEAGTFLLTGRHDGDHPGIDPTLTVRSDTDDGPAIILAEIVTFWAPPPPDPCPGLRQFMKRLGDKLNEEPGPDPIERKQILLRLSELRKVAQMAHCK